MAPSSLVALPFDIIYAINEHAYNAGRQHDLAVLSRVSKLFNEAATPWLYRTVTLDFMKPIDDSKCLKTLELARHCFRIKELKVIGLFPMADYAPLLDLIELIPWLPNLQRFSWKAAGPIPKSLILVLQNHLPLKEIKSESRFFWDRQGPNFEFDIDQDIVTANLPQYRQYRDWMRVPRIQISIDGTSKCEDLCLAGYAFPHPPGIIAGWQLTPPDLESFHSFDHIHLGRLRTLELKGCQDVGFMYNVLLHHISGLQLKFLILDQTETRPGYTGYTGREKLHEFLTTYKGLEEISFFNLAQSRQSIRTISAQRDSLRTLKLSESGTRGGSKAYVPWHLTDVDLIASQREHLQDVEDVASIRRALPNLQDLIIDGKRIE